MTAYRMKLDNGTTKVVNSTSPLKAKYKYYGSNSHFRTEATILSVSRVKKIKKRRTQRRDFMPFGNFKLSGFGGFRF